MDYLKNRQVSLFLRKKQNACITKNNKIYYFRYSSFCYILFPSFWTFRLVAYSSLIIIFYALYSYFILNRTITSWTSQIISFMFIGGVQLLSIGIIGEYISRMNRNILDRPLYIVKETNIK